MTSPFNCTGGPALAVLCGFTKDGLPLSLQIAGRPFDDARVLRAGHAFEQASGFFKRRPVLIAGAKAAAIDPKPWVPDTSAVAPAVRAQAENAAAHAGLRLPGSDHGGACRRRALGAGHGAPPAARSSARGGIVSIFDPGRDVD